jgi:hypothetical protein
MSEDVAVFTTENLLRYGGFTTALLQHMPTPGLEIGAVMKRVHRRDQINQR